MSGARAAILAGIRRGLKRGALSGDARAELESRLAGPPVGPVPDRSRANHALPIDLFESMAAEVAATLERLPDSEAVPGAVARYLKANNLPAALRLAPADDLQALPWDSEPLLSVEAGPADPGDQVSVTGAFAGIAETGTLMLLSGPAGPTTLNFLPDNHIVVLRASDVVGPYEAAWERLRARNGRGSLPRTVNFITGPSRTADIEQTIQLGAHGPRRLHILLIDDRDESAS